MSNGIKADIAFVPTEYRGAIKNIHNAKVAGIEKKFGVDIARELILHFGGSRKRKTKRKRSILSVKKR